MEPAVAEQCKQQLMQQHVLFKQQTAALASAVYRQVYLANEIPVFVEENGSRIQVWNPLESVKAEVTAAEVQGTHLDVLQVHFHAQTTEDRHTHRCQSSRGHSTYCCCCRHSTSSLLP